MYVPYLLKMQIKEHTVFFLCTETALHTPTLTHDGMHSVKITQDENMKTPQRGILADYIGTPYNVGSVLWRLFSTLEAVQFIGRITSVLWEIA